MPAAGRLAAGRYIRLTARDDGCGLDPRAREHLFESFFTTKGPGRGNGLGLATATETMRAAGGAIRLAEQAGQGTVFHLYFPILPNRPNRKCAAIAASQQSAHE